MDAFPSIPAIGQMWSEGGAHGMMKVVPAGCLQTWWGRTTGRAHPVRWAERWKSSPSATDQRNSGTWRQPETTLNPSTADGEGDTGQMLEGKGRCRNVRIWQSWLEIQARPLPSSIPYWTSTAPSFLLCETRTRPPTQGCCKAHV